MILSGAMRDAYNVYVPSIGAKNAFIVLEGNYKYVYTEQTHMRYRLIVRRSGRYRNFICVEPTMRNAMGNAGRCST